MLRTRYELITFFPTGTQSISRYFAACLSKSKTIQMLLLAFGKVKYCLLSTGFVNVSDASGVKV